VCVSVVPTVLVANKADLEIGREVTTEEGQRLAKDLRCVFVITSVTLNISLLFILLVGVSTVCIYLDIACVCVCVCRCGFRELSVAEAVSAVEAAVFQLIRFGSALFQTRFDSLYVTAVAIHRY